LPKAEVPNIKAKYVLDKKELEAPIAAHQRVGEIQLYDRDKVVAHWPLVTLESVDKGAYSHVLATICTTKSNRVG
jgi:D-alanyl-D-alanine carboxypeptidase (penicillin-binding protein 5/6)